nr:immunoglobulin heavy chain junction region [Macaca mulatta]MOV54689.1 immunoglobulin heavy chain junction region [Macaca mulatta]MOV54973.1 immunoglobulin heavy chain junction region [Macaca mulatta]MOV55105.1 immunoglobulin heavy chain junction region [Macaca mulatta]MOV55147.1 immunoglobulin heavy chain junction region [Macaca mulatta]
CAKRSCSGIYCYGQYYGLDSW